MNILLLLLLVPPLDAARAFRTKALKMTWIWSQAYIEDVDRFVNFIEIGKQPDLSFVELTLVNQETLWIDLVQKSDSDWDLSPRFCSTVLPATLTALFQFYPGVDFKKLKRIRVVNVAKVIGCRCYVRVLVGMGFRAVLTLEHAKSFSALLGSADEIPLFCANALPEIITQVPHGGNATLLPLSAEQKYILSQARVHSRTVTPLVSHL
jgi:hypothetical protein